MRYVVLKTARPTKDGYIQTLWAIRDLQSGYDLAYYPSKEVAYQGLAQMHDQNHLEEQTE